MTKKQQEFCTAIISRLYLIGDPLPKGPAKTEIGDLIHDIRLAKNGHATKLDATHWHDERALGILTKMSDADFNAFLDSENVPPRVRMLIRGQMVDWRKVLPNYYTKSIAV